MVPNQFQLFVLATLCIVLMTCDYAHSENKVGMVTLMEMAAHQKKVAKPNPKLSLSRGPKVVHQLSPVDPYSNSTVHNAQAAQLFTGRGLSGVNFVLYGQYCPDLSKCFEVSIDDAISSARIFGVWVFYSGYSYGVNDDLEVSWVWGKDYQYDFSELNDMVSSVRFIGPENDFLADSVTLFSQEFFKAWEYFVALDMQRLTDWEYFAHSAAVTGSSPWTIYEFDYFQGKSMCLFPGPDGNPGMFPTKQTMGMSVIRSVRKGCFSQIRLSPIQMTNKSDMGLTGNSNTNSNTATNSSSVPAPAANNAASPSSSNVNLAVGAPGMPQFQ